MRVVFRLSVLALVAHLALFGTAGGANAAAGRLRPGATLFANCTGRAAFTEVLACKPGRDATLHPLGLLSGRHGQEIDYQLLRDGHVPVSNPVAGDALIQAVSQKNAMPVLGGSWTGLGPAPISYPGSQYTDTGRVLAFAYQKASGTLYLGSADGGVWKTANGGTTWTPLTDSMPSLAIDALALDPNNSQTIFAGTGEMAYCGDCLYGVGVYKSTDGGNTWTLYGNNVFSRNVVSSIVVDPSNSNDVYAGIVNRAGGNLGVALSTDGGQTWSDPGGTALTSHDVTDLAVDAGGDVYAAVSNSGASNGVYLSTDHGHTWTSVSAGLPSSTADQYKISLAPNTAGNSLSAQTLYVVAGSLATEGILGVYRSRNGGGSWTQIAQPTTAASYEDQAWYDIYIAVDPNDTTGNTVYFGLSDIYKTTNGLATSPIWKNLTCVYGGCLGAAIMHPDQHAVAFGGATAYFGNDGGVYASSNGGTSFTAANGNLALSQFYGGALGTGATASRVLGGLQDNGTVESNGGSWVSPVGGDGMQTAIDYTQNQNMYGEWESGDTFATHNGTSWSEQISGLNMSENANWSAPLVIDPNSPQTLYLGRTHLYRTVNGEASWSNVSASVTPDTALSAVAVSRSDPNTIYIGDFDGHTWATHNGGTSWSSLDGSSCDPAHPSPYYCTIGGITSIAVDPTNSQIIYVTENAFNGAQKYHVFKSSDGGVTWNDVSTSLPDVPFQSVVVSPTAANTIYASADVGIYVSFDGGASWSVLGTGLPNVSIYQVVASADGSSLVAFSHGRGAWRIPTPSNLPGLATNLVVTPGNEQLTASWSAPASDGGFPIDRYDVSISDGHGFSQNQQITNLGNLTATFTGLSNGTTYSISVTAHNSIGSGTPATATGTPSTVPDKVTGVSATPGNQQSTVAWSAPGNEGSPITGYVVDCEPGAHQPSSQPGGSAASAIVPNLTNGTQYSCSVSASNANGTGTASDPVTLTPLTVPGEPSSLALSTSPGTLTATWDTAASDGGAAIDRYDVSITDGAGYSSSQQITNLANLAATFTGLTNGTSYTVSVSAHNAAGSGVAATAAGIPVTVPGIPSNLQLTSDNGQVEVAWNPPSSTGGSVVTGYTVSIYQSDGVTLVPGALVAPYACNSGVIPNQCSTTVGGLTNGTTYVIAVVASNAAGTGTSATGSVSPQAVPGIPTNLVLTPGNGTVSAIWGVPASNGGAAIDRYDVTVTDGRGYSAAQQITNLNSLTATFIGLTNGTVYTVSVTGHNGAGSGNPATGTSTPATVPGIPASLSLTSGNGQLQSSWSAPSDTGGAAIDRYDVSISDGNAFTQTQQVTNLTATFTGLANGTAYTVSVSAHNSAGSGSAATKTGVPSSVPDKVSGVSASRGDGRATIMWSTPNYEGSPLTGFVVECDPGGHQPATAPDGFATSVVVPNLNNGTQYSCTVAATNADGTGPTSDSVAVTPAGPPDAPTGLSLTAGDAQLQASWGAPSNTGGLAIDRYDVSITDGNGFSASQQVTNLGNLSATFTGLTNGTTYTVSVTAHNSLGSGAAATTTGIPSTVPDKVTGVTATPGNGQATVSWSTPGNGGSSLTGYAVDCEPGGHQPASPPGGSATSAVVPNLINGTEYTCTVAATNANGPGPASDPVTVTPFNPNTPPTITVSGQTTVAYGSVLTLSIGVSDGDGDTVSAAASGLPSGFAVTTTGSGGSRTITVKGTGRNGAVTVAPGSYALTVTPNDGVNAPVSQVIPITVSKQLPTITPGAANPIGMSVTTATGLSSTLTYTATLRETWYGASTGNPLVTNTPIGLTATRIVSNGSNAGTSIVNVTCSETVTTAVAPGPYTLTARCTNLRLPVGVYDIHLAVKSTSAYYQGSTDSVLTVYSSSTVNNPWKDYGYGAIRRSGTTGIVTGSFGFQETPCSTAGSTNPNGGAVYVEHRATTSGPMTSQGMRDVVVQTSGLTSCTLTGTSIKTATVIGAASRSDDANPGDPYVLKLVAIGGTTRKLGISVYAGLDTRNLVNDSPTDINYSAVPIALLPSPLGKIVTG